MDYLRRRQAERFWKNVFVLSTVTGLYLALPTTVLGLILGFVIGFWWVLWVGLSLLGLSTLGWFVSMVSAAGIAKMDVEETLQRYIADQDDDD